MFRVEPRVRAADVGEREVLRRCHAEAVDREAGRLEALRYARGRLGQLFSETDAAPDTRHIALHSCLIRDGHGLQQYWHRGDREQG